VNSLPKDSSVAQLVAIVRPPTLLPDARDPIEKNIFKVAGKLVSVKQEPDRDYRLIIADESGKTMIAEIPSPDCYKGGDPPVAAKFRDARLKINEIVGLPTGRDIEPPQGVQVAITGVGFFDTMHGQRGMAPNGLELHPVLALEILDLKKSAAP